MLEDTLERDVGEVSRGKTESNANPSSHSSEFVANALNKAYENLYSTKKEGFLKSIWMKLTGFLRRKAKESPSAFGREHVQAAAQNLMGAKEPDDDLWTAAQERLKGEVPNAA